MIQCVDSNDSMISVCVLVFSMLKFVGVVVSLRIGCVVSCCDVQCLPNMLRHLFCKLSSPSCVICLFQRNVLPVFAYFVLFVTSLFRILFFREFMLSSHDFSTVKDIRYVRVGAFGFISMFSFVMKFDSDAARLVS